jgi:hypothetical protein
MPADNQRQHTGMSILPGCSYRAGPNPLGLPPCQDPEPERPHPPPRTGTPFRRIGRPGEGDPGVVEGSGRTSARDLPFVFARPVGAAVRTPSGSPCQSMQHPP